MTARGAGQTRAIRIEDAEFAWPGEGGFRLRVPEFAVTSGETLFLHGDSGSGKSTLLSLICGINTAQSGRVAVAGCDLGSLRAAARDRFRAEQIGVIFQMFNLLPHASPIDNILLPLRFAPSRRAACPDPRAEARRLGGKLGLSEAVLSQATAASLSTGQQQRVAVARALIGRPPLIVADEPTSALDAGAQAAFLEVLFAQVRAAGTTLLMVSHDARLAERFDRTVALSEIAVSSRSAEGPA